VSILPGTPVPPITYPVVFVGTGINISDTMAGQGDGLDLAAGSDGSTITGLAIFGAPGAALGVFSSNNVISGSTFETSGDGVDILNGASNNVLGAGNLIASNSGNGVLIEAQTPGSAVTGNVVEGNFIGTDAAGDKGIGNGAGGVVLTKAASNNTIGGLAAGAGNVISGNKGDGVQISGNGTSGNLIQGNLIGTDATGPELSLSAMLRRSRSSSLTAARGPPT
jgi:titin